MDTAIVAVLSELGGSLALKEEQRTTLTEDVCSLYSRSGFGKNFSLANQKLIQMFPVNLTDLGNIPFGVSG